MFNGDNILDAVRDFDIEILNLRRVDLSIDHILDVAPNVEELHLYSCDWTYLSQWTSEEGAVILPKVRVSILTLHFVG